MKTNNFEKLPTSVLLVGAILLIVAFGGLIYLAVFFEGVASILLLLFGFVILWFQGKNWGLDNGLGFILAIIVFAILGIIFDGAGNFIYNKPLELAFCPPETELMREVSTYETEEGENYLHNFSCHTLTQGQTVKEIPLYFSIGLRFFEYILLGCLMIGIYAVFSRFRKAKNQSQGT